MAYAARPAGMPAGVHSPPLAPHHHQQIHHMQQQQQPPQPSGGPPGYQGTLAPGTRVQVGAVVVTVKRYLSQGGFAHVYLVTSSQPIPMPGSSSGETLHVLKRMAVPDKEALAVVRSEVEVHKSLRNHPNIVHFIEASASALPTGGYEVFILMEYCAGGGIIDLMNSRLRNRLTEKEVLKIFGDVCLGLAVMHHHDPPLMHRDLKIENILLSPPSRERPGQGPTYKLCDFGSTKPILSRRAPRSMEEIKRLEEDLNRSTTLQYRAPEMVDVYQRRVIDEKADIWAMGVFLYKLCYYTTPFEENGGGPLAILNARYRFPPTPPYSTKIKDLIASMLQEQSTNRPNIDEVILGVHRILGTAPPASALHYTQLSSSGKQVTPLPSVVRTIAKDSTGSASSSSSGATYSSGPDAAARALAIAQGRANVPAPSKALSGRKSGTPDLIDMAPSEEEKRRAEDEEMKRRAEAITPMRRGRPTKAPATAAGGVSAAVASSARPLIAQLTGENAAVRGAASSSAPPPKPASASPTGFADSFEGASEGGAKASSLSPGAAAAAATIASSASSRNFFSAAQSSSLDVPSRATGSVSPGEAASRSTPLRHSPALPGFSASNSPAPRESASVRSPPPPAAAATNESVDVDASRFPSVEELDARYAIPPTPSSSSTSTSTAAAARRALAAAADGSQSSSSGAAPQRSSTISIPGMSSRASLSSIAGRFGGTTGSAVGKLNLTGTAASSSPLHEASTGGAQSLSTPHERQRKTSVTSRWPHAGAGGASSGANGSSKPAERPRPPSTAKPSGFQLPSSASTVGASTGSVLSPNASGRPMPPLPARKPMPKDWLTGDHDEEAEGQGAKSPPAVIGNGTGVSANSRSSAKTATANAGSPPLSATATHGPLRWEGKPLSAEPSKEAYRSPARYGASASASASAAEQDADADADADAGKEKDAVDEDVSGDSSEDEGPEDLDLPSKAAGVASAAGKTRPASMLPLPSRTPGRVQPPAWLAAEKERAGAASTNGAQVHAMPRQTGKMSAPSWPPAKAQLSTADLGLPSAKRSSSPAFPSSPAASAKSPSSASVSVDAATGGSSSDMPPLPSSASAVRAPAWDEDDEEMRNLPLPDMERPYESRSPLKPEAPLVDIGGEAGEEAQVGVEKSLQGMGLVDATPSESIDGAGNIDSSAAPATGGVEAIPSPSPTGTSQPILGGASWLDKHNAAVFGVSGSFSPIASPASPASPAPAPNASNAGTVLPGAPLGVKERQRALLSQTASSSSTGPVSSSAAPSSGGTAPPLHKPKPIALRSSVVAPKRTSTTMATAGAKANLKPWEREAAEKEEVERFGAVGRAKEVAEAEPDSEDDEEDVAIAAATTEKGSDKERFSGVSSLISQWQMNAERGAPGWGRIGESGGAVRTARVGNAGGMVAGGARPLPLEGRLPGRDV